MLVPEQKTEIELRINNMKCNDGGTDVERIGCGVFVGEWGERGGESQQEGEERANVRRVMAVDDNDISCI